MSASKEKQALLEMEVAELKKQNALLIEKQKEQELLLKRYQESVAVAAHNQKVYGELEELKRTLKDKHSQEAGAIAVHNQKVYGELEEMKRMISAMASKEANVNCTSSVRI